MEVVVTTGAVRHAKLQLKCHTNKPTSSNQKLFCVNFLQTICLPHSYTQARIMFFLLQIFLCDFSLLLVLLFAVFVGGDWEGRSG